MQNLIKIIGKKNGADLNLIREYLQVLILKAIYGSKYGKGLSFIGGTCLRICHDLKRYSEDLDFTLDREIPKYSFLELNELIVGFLRDRGFEIDFGISEDKTVQKSFIRVSKVLHTFKLSPLQSQKIHIKLEVDTNSVKALPDDIETFFVTKFDETFPILKHTDSTLFAGKIRAILSRSYAKGRDFYDLIWYLNHKIEINFRYLDLALKQFDLDMGFENKTDVIEALEAQVEKTDVNKIMADIRPFLESGVDDNAWIEDYKRVFAQVSKKYL